MSTIEDFENASVGATATDPQGRRAVKTFNERNPWRQDVDKWTSCSFSEEKLAESGFTLDPAPAPAPTTAREALDLAWNLAYPVKEGQMFPAGTELLQKNLDGTIRAAIMPEKKPATEIDENHTRTLDPLPDPEPAWLDAPAVLANTDFCSSYKVWIPVSELGKTWKCACCRSTMSWDFLRDVTPLYPKETDR